MWKVLLAVIFVCASVTYASADLSGEKTVFLVQADGSEVSIGTIKFTPDDDNTKFKFTLDESKFAVYFLSMRNFNCYETSKQKVCYLPYPYKTHGQITKDDLRDLEYNLLFIRVLPDEYGINAWNGIYYKLSLLDDGTVSGQLMNADLNVLAVPPDDPYARPIVEGEMSVGNADKHQFPTLSIR